jgi:hypothetical protein
MTTQVSWQPGGSSTGITYELRKSFDNTNWSTPTAVANGATSFSDVAVEAGKTYYYQVRARNASGISAYSSSASVTVGGGGANSSKVFNITVAVYEMTNGAHKIGKVTIYTGGINSDNGE